MRYRSLFLYIYGDSSKNSVLITNRIRKEHCVMRKRKLIGIICIVAALGVGILIGWGGGHLLDKHKTSDISYSTDESIETGSSRAQVIEGEGEPLNGDEQETVVATGIIVTEKAETSKEDDSGNKTIYEDVTSMGEIAIAPEEEEPEAVPDTMPVSAHKAEMYEWQADSFLSEGDKHTAAGMYEISLEYMKDPEVLLKLADLYAEFELTEGDGPDYFWNFDRATELYIEAYLATGDTEPFVSFCKLCDGYIIDSIMSNGYKYKILDYYGIDCEFVINENLPSGEYRYYPDFDINGGKMVIEGKDIDPAFIENVE